MKVFSVSIQVRITQVGVVVDAPETPAGEEAPKKFNDDPIDKQEQMLNKYLDRVANIQGPRLVSMNAAPPSDSHMLTETVRITADTFEDLQAILSKFHAVAKELSPVPDSLLQDTARFIPSVPAFPGYGGMG